jgi:hypothetical protein
MGLFNNKSAQITVFIILGVLLLVVAGLVYYLFFTEEDFAEAEIEESIEEAPVEVKPVHSFMTSCAKDVALKGVVELGKHGGYINMLDEDLAEQEFKINILNPTESDAVTIAADESTHIAYWWYMRSKNTCFNCELTDRNAPTLKDIETQLERYMKKEIETCLDKFSGFRRQGFSIIKTANTTVDVTVAEEDVTFYLEYPIKVTLDQKSTDISKVFVRVPLDLEEFHELADEITKAEVDNNYLEDIFLFLLSIYSSNDMGRLPPIYASDTGVAKNFWVKQVVTQRIRELLTVYIPLIQFNSTLNSAPYLVEDSAENQTYYKIFYREYLSKDYGEYEVNFIYLDHPIYYHTNPGGTITSVTEVKERELSIFGLSFGTPFEENVYDYLYDVSFPVIVELKKNNSLYGEPYRFYFAMEANIRNNKRIQDWMAGNGTMGPFDRSKVSMTPKKESEMDIAASGIRGLSGGANKSIFCNKNQRIGSFATINLKDSVTGEGVDKVRVKFGCGSHRSCTVGETTLDTVTNESNLTTQLPICLGGGYLRVTKEGYKEKTVPKLTSDMVSNFSIDVKLDPLVKKNISVMKFVTTRFILHLDPKDNSSPEIDNWLIWNSTLTKLGNSEQFILNIQKIDDPAYEQPFSKTLILYGNESETSEYYKSIELVPGKYVLNGQYMDMDGAVFAANCSHMCADCTSDYCKEGCMWYPDDYTSFCSEYSVLTGILTGGVWPCHTCSCTVDEFYPEENFTMAPAVMGGIDLNASSPWVITESDLAQPGDVEFRVLGVPPPRCFDDINETVEVEGFYTDRIGVLMPRFT